MKHLPPVAPPEPAPTNPWDAVNALKIDIAAAQTGGASAERITELQAQLADAEAIARSSA